MIKTFFKFLCRSFVKITGFIPFILFVHPKYFYVSEKAKKDFKKSKESKLLVANHTSIKDYYSLIYAKPFSVIHTFTSELVNKSFFMKGLNSIMGNIAINRNEKVNKLKIQKAFSLLEKGKTLLIFPEGKLETNPGELLSFNDFFAYLSIKTNTPVTPIYINGKFGLFKRPIIVIGEQIQSTGDFLFKEPNNTEINEYKNTVINKIYELKTTCFSHQKVKTKTLFTLKYWALDFAKITSIPIFYLVFPTKKYFVGNKKEIKSVLKYNALICGNHCGPCDPFFMYFHFFSRRVRVIAAEEVWNVKNFRHAIDHSGAIKYRRKTLDKIDLVSFKETIDTLNGKGVVGLFPEGHINFDGNMDSAFQAGSATFSLITNTPIIPFIFVTPYKYFKLNKVIIGNPIYPKNICGNNYIVSNDTINKYNNYIYDEMHKLYELGIKKRGKNYDKTKYFGPFKRSD